jgi:hypothetical protein
MLLAFRKTLIYQLLYTKLIYDIKLFIATNQRIKIIDKGITINKKKNEWEIKINIMSNQSKSINVLEKKILFKNRSFNMHIKCYKKK